MKSNKRIQINQKENETVIEIAPINEASKATLLLVWLIVWTLCGIVVFSQFFSNLSKEEKLMMAVWMAFWAYFEYKISSVYVWRKNGKEKITLNNDSIIYSQIISGKETAKEYIIENISDLKTIEFGKNNFSESFQNSYWVKGNESVYFTHLSQKIGLGLQLNKDEAQQVLQAIAKRLKKKK